MALQTNKELTKEDILARCDVDVYYGATGRISLLNAMEEYANEWKVKYDELKEIVKDYTFKFAELNQASNELKAENEELKADFKSRGLLINKWKHSHEALEQQHQQLKDNAQRLADALDEAKRLIEFIDKHIEIPENLFESYSNDLMNVMHLIDESGLSENDQSKGGEKEALVRTVVAIAEEVSRDAESAEAYLKSEGVDVEKVKADAAYFAWKSRLMAIVAEHTGHTAVINDKEARKSYNDGFTPEQCFRETWQSDGD